MSNTSPRPRVAVIGAGMSGMLAGIRLLEQGLVDLHIYEKADRIGGTWRENTYPNVACDVFSPSYTYSFAQNPDWERRFAGGAEIQRYFEAVRDRYGLDRYIRYGADLTEARWDGERWQLRFADGSAEAADVLVSAVGALHFPKPPDIPGLDRFAGACFHTARWDHSVDLAGKRVGVIGTGSTSSQVVPGIVDRVKELFLFQRTPQWMIAITNRRYTGFIKTLRRKSPAFARLNHRADLLVFHLASSAVRGNRLLHRVLEWAARANLATVRDPELRRKLTPDYAPGCKRIIMSGDFYPAIQKPNAHLVTDGIREIVAEGVVTKDGSTIPLDVLVLATGFEAYKTTVNTIGEDGRTLADAWAGGILMHRTIGVPGFPNYFVVFGPYSPIGNMSIIANSEVQVAYILQCIELIARGRVRTMTPRREVAEKQKAEMSRALEGTIWQAGGCQSWYLDASGEALSWPWSMKRFERELAAPRLDEYHIG